MTSLLDSLAASSAVRFPEEIALFRKALLTLSAVAADVSEQMAVDSVLVRHGATQFLQGLLRRPWGLGGFPRSRRSPVDRRPGRTMRRPAGDHAALSGGRSRLVWWPTRAALI
jgi:hypothetical protein